MSESAGMLRSVNRVLVAALFASALGCGHKSSSEPDEEPGIFIAQQEEFTSFSSWDTYPLEPGTHAGLERSGDRTIYLNETPPEGSTEYPVGTIIVKTIEKGPPTDWILHAMAKRGAGFNKDGAVDWEFFELRLDEQNIPIILWRGAEPPIGHSYEALPGTMVTEEQACNGCHSPSDSPDSILSPEMLALLSME